MTLHVSSDCVRMHTMVYTGQDLTEYGESARAILDEVYASATNLYWKLDEKGLYYIKLDGGSSEKICSTTISLIPPEAIEDNDTWYRATPLYEEFTQAFDISAENDSEWFRFTVPQGSQKAVLLNISVIESGRGWSDFPCIGKHILTGRMMRGFNGGIRFLVQQRRHTSWNRVSIIWKYLLVRLETDKN